MREGLEQVQANRALYRAFRFLRRLKSRESLLKSPAEPHFDVRSRVFTRFPEP